MKLFHIISLKWSNGGDTLVFWGADNSGYTKDVNAAGIYTEEQLNSRKRYYSNKNTMPVPMELLHSCEKLTTIAYSSDHVKTLGIREHVKNAEEY